MERWELIKAFWKIQRPIHSINFHETRTFLSAMILLKFRYFSVNSTTKTVRVYSPLFRCAYIYPQNLITFIYIQYFGIQKDNFEIICGYNLNLNLNILMLALHQHQQQFIFIEPVACVHNEH